MPTTMRRHFVGPEKRKDAPKRSQEQNEGDYSKHILVKGQAVVHLRSGPRIIGSAKIRIIFNKQQRKRNQNESCAREQAAKCSDRLSIRYNNEDHHNIPNRLNPAFERHVREIGPDDADKAKQEIDQDRPVGSEEPERPPSSMDKNTDSRNQQCREECPINRAAIQLNIGSGSRRNTQPN